MGRVAPQQGPFKAASPLRTPINGTKSMGERTTQEWMGATLPCTRSEQERKWNGCCNGFEVKFISTAPAGTRPWDTLVIGK